VLNLVLYLAPVVLQSGAVLLMSQWGAKQPGLWAVDGRCAGPGDRRLCCPIACFSRRLLAAQTDRNAQHRPVPCSTLTVTRWSPRSKFGAPVTVAGVAGAIGYSVQSALVAGSVRNWTSAG